MSDSIINPTIPLLRTYLSQTCAPDTMSLTSPELIALLQKAQQSGIYPMVYEAMAQMGLLNTLPQEEKQFLQSTMRRAVMSNIHHMTSFFDIYQTLSRGGVRAIVLKGVACRSIYPHADYRQSNDEDILIDPNQLALCHRILCDNGFRCEEEEQEMFESKTLTQKKDFCYVNPTNGLRLEVHILLFEPTSIIGTTFLKLYENPMEHAVQMELNGQAFWSLEYGEHLLYLVLHFYKHFINQGIGIRQVMDIVLFSKKYEELIDWEVFDCRIKEVKLEYLYAGLLQVGEEYLGQISEKAKERYKQYFRTDVSDLLEEILSGGIYGRQDMQRRHTAAVIMGKIEKRYAGVGYSHTWKVLFPKKEYMIRRYSWLKQYPWLLPVAWGMRIVTEIKMMLCRNKWKDKSKGSSFQELNEREILFKKYGVLE